MRLLSRAAAILVLLAAATLSVIGAVFAADLIERDASADVAAALDARRLDWAGVATDGLKVRLTGDAPSESGRFEALGAAGEVVDAARVIDAMTVAPAEPIDAPQFSLEILRNEGDISLIGLVPSATGRAAPAERLRGVTDDADITNLLETAAFPVPDGWSEAVGYALDALARTPRARVSVAPGHVEIEAVAADQRARADLHKTLADMAPATVEIALDISAPRPVLAPFLLRFARDGDGARLIECSAGSAEAAARIEAAARKAGATTATGCRIGLGRPAASWADAAERSIAALAALGRGSLTMSDADITLTAAASTPQAAFEKITGRLDSALPDLFALEAVRAEPEKAAPDSGPQVFVASKGGEGEVQLRGPVPGPRVRKATLGLARARLGGDGEPGAALHTASGLPDAWPNRILAAVEALAKLHDGTASVDADTIEIKGTSGDEASQSEVTRLLTAKLGETAALDVDVAYDETLDPTAGLPTPADCVGDINAALDAGKIAFAPGSAEIAPEAGPTLDKIAAILQRCEDIEMRIEIAGYTDSQGGEEMNKRLSRQRASAVLSALAKRRVLTDDITAAGYGESVPIADNATAAGREANRRIEVHLRGPEMPGPPPPTRVTAAPADKGDGSD